MASFAFSSPGGSNSMRNDENNSTNGSIYLSTPCHGENGIMKSLNLHEEFDTDDLMTMISRARYDEQGCDEEREYHQNGEIATPMTSRNSQEVVNPPPNSDERRRNELEESERLAWQLMEEESMRAYEMQLEFMRNNPEIFTQEDMDALNSVLNENNADGDEEFVDDEEEGQENEDSSESWSYDRLLEIARVVGDVKTERWRLRSAAIFNSLPSVTYDQIVVDSSHVRSLEQSCSICMEEYQSTDEVKVLPCRHYFHLNCSKGWLEDNNSCPMCKGKVTSSP